MNRALAFLIVLLLPAFGHAQSRPLAFTHVTLIDGTGAPPKTDVTVIINGERISAVGKSAELPANAEVIDASGMFMIPGLWDMHVHWIDKPALGLYLANGVTGVRQMFGDLNQVHARQEIAQGNLVGPRMIVASPIVDGPKPVWPGSMPVANAADGRRAVQKIKKDGYDFVKVYSLLTPDGYFAIADEAKKLGLPFAGHIPDLVPAAKASDAGQKSIEHLHRVLDGCSRIEDQLHNELVTAYAKPNVEPATVYNLRKSQSRQVLETYSEEKAAALFAHFVKNGTWQDPTLTVLRAMANLDDAKFTNDPRLKYVSPMIRRMWDPKNDFRLKNSTPADFAFRRTLLEKQYELVAGMHKAGVKFLAGTDVLNPYCFPGFSLHDELDLLVHKCHFTPLQALQCATRNAAEYLGRLNDLGTVEPGKLADLVLLSANPLDDIRNTTKIQAVVVNGQLFRRTKLDSLLSKVEWSWKEKPKSTPPAGGGAEAKEWTPKLMMHINAVNSVQVSPDGKEVVYAVRRAVMDGDNSEYRTQLFLAHADGSDPYALTQSESTSDNPRWSPDGQWIAFTSNRSGKRNLWAIRAHGGEAKRLTDVKGDVAEFSWSPDGKHIAFTAVDPDKPEEEKAKREKSYVLEVDTHYKMSRLYVIAVVHNAAQKAEPRALTPAKYHLGSGSVGTPTFDWSPDSKTIVFSHVPTPRADDWTRSDISLIDAADGKTRPLAHSAAAETSPKYSPDGRWIAFVKSDNPPTWAGDHTIQVVAASGGSPRELASTYNRDPALVGWSKDGSEIYYTEAYGTITRLCAMPLTGGPRVLQQDEGVMQNVSLNAGRSAFGFSYETLTRAAEAHVSKVDSGVAVAVSAVNQDLPELPIGDSDVLRWKSADGREIEGLLTYPPDFELHKRYPLLLVIHGGPAGGFNQRCISAPYLYPVAAFCARGYLVLRCNPRGSTGYGKDFRYANYKDWGGADFHDLMGGVDRVIEDGMADPQRLGVMGWSYGGFMTSWTITQTKRFKAASVGAGVTNLMSFTGTADIPSFLPDYFRAEPWNDLDIYRKHSAMFNVKGVSTPTLIQHGDKDERVPIGQGFEFYNALKRQGCPVQMVVYPRTPHGPQEPKLLLDVMTRNLEWFDKYLRPQPAKEK